MDFKPILHFLTELTANNNREWFNDHKETYTAVRANFEEFIGQLLKGMADSEPDYGVLDPHHCVFRIYRDVRFSKNKAPYKNHFAAGIGRSGKRVHVPGYHLHIIPGNQSFFAGGVWHPDKDMLAKVRQEIDYNFEEYDGLVKHLQTLPEIDPFVDEEALIRPPKGYEADNPALEYLKMKNFLQIRMITDQELMNDGFLEKLLSTYQIMRPFVAFIERALDS